MTAVAQTATDEGRNREAAKMRAAMSSASGRWMNTSATTSQPCSQRQYGAQGGKSRGWDGRKTHMSTEKGVLPGCDRKSNREAHAPRNPASTLRKPVIGLHLEVGEPIRQSSYSEPLVECVCGWSRRGVGRCLGRDDDDGLRMGKRSSKKIPTCCVGGGLSGRTRRGVEHDKLKELRVEREEGRPGLRERQECWGVRGRACMVAVGIGVAISCILPVVVAAEQR
ncbi:hypothetical protein B0H14DRAFT_3141677 [Mycena olivaceomarginata]|nr:hypothetical protein B0H14DRAFT_3141677 [Mycena olivaceomarginata]